MVEHDHEYDDVPIACTLDEAERERRRDRTAETLIGAIRSAEEREDGYEFVFDGSDAVLEAVSAFVRREATCCSFARFRIEVPQGFEEVRLLFAGPEGTKGLLETGLIEEFDLTV